MTTRQISSDTLLPKSLNLNVLLLFPMPSGLLLLQICSWLPFLLPLSGFSVLHNKFGTTTNASLISCSLQRCLKFIIFWVKSLQPFPHSPSPFLHCPLLLCIRNTFISFLHPHTMKGCYHVRTLSFLPLLPTTASTQLCFLFSGRSGKARKCPFWD